MKERSVVMRERLEGGKEQRDKGNGVYRLYRVKTARRGGRGGYGPKERLHKLLEGGKKKLGRTVLGRSK